jgi:hypothetical protein
LFPFCKNKNISQEEKQENCRRKSTAKPSSKLVVKFPYPLLISFSLFPPCKNNNISQGEKQENCRRKSTVKPSLKLMLTY